jgi:hypothetical protein
MYIKITLTDYESFRKCVKFRNKLFLSNLITFLAVIVYAVSENIFAGITFSVLFIITLLYFVICKIWKMFIADKGYLFIFEYVLIKDKEYSFSEFYVDLSMNMDKKYRNDKEYIIKKVKNDISTVCEFGNFFVHKKTKKKFEFILPDDKELLFIIQHFDVCSSEGYDCVSLCDTTFLFPVLF